MNIPRRMRRRFKVPPEAGAVLPILGYSSSGLVHSRKAPASIHYMVELQANGAPVRNPDGSVKRKLNPIEAMWNGNHGPNH